MRAYAYKSDEVNKRNCILSLKYAIFPSNKVGGRVVRWCWVNFQHRGVLLIWITVGQGPTALTVGAGGSCLDIFLSCIGRRPDID